jgi:hypothetical protein
LPTRFPGCLGDILYSLDCAARNAQEIRREPRSERSRIIMRILWNTVHDRGRNQRGRGKRSRTVGVVQIFELIEFL